MSNFHYVYILVDEATGNHFYIGCTEDLKSRLAKHNSGEVPHTSKFKPWHGSDRTGCAVTASRIVFENWSVEDAISELMQPQYGHHKYIYTNIPVLLRKADWQKIKATVLNGKK